MSSCESDIPVLEHVDLPIEIRGEPSVKNYQAAKKKSAVEKLVAEKIAADKRRREKKAREEAYLSYILYIHAVYGALDGLSLSYSMTNYFIIISLYDSSSSPSDVMHNWLMTPAGIALTVIEATAMIAFSMLANIYQEDDVNAFKRNIAIYWPYFRDTMKSLKNAYKGIRSTMQVAGVLGTQDLRYMIVPLGLALGVVAVVNRLWYRRMRDARKALQKINLDMIPEIKALTDRAAYDVFCKGLVIGAQSLALRRKGIASATYAGLVDGLYLFMGVMSLAALSPPVFIVMVACSVIFTLTSVATRVYEEYDYQRKLISTAAAVKEALCEKERDLLVATLSQLSNPSITPFSEGLAAEQEKIRHLIELKNQELKSKQTDARSLLTLSYRSAALAGLKNGLVGYGAIAGLMFAVATFTTMLSVAFPPALLIACVAAGIGCLIGFLAHSLIKNYLARRANELTPKYYFQEFFEVLRSFFSGIGKGQKSVDYTLNALQESDDQGHYHDSPIMLWLTALSAMIYAASLALRAYVRGFCDDQPKQTEPALEKKTNPSSDSELPKVLELPTLERESEIELFLKPSGMRGTDDGLCPQTDSLQQYDVSPVRQTVSPAQPYGKFFTPRRRIIPQESTKDLSDLTRQSYSQLPGIELRI